MAGSGVVQDPEQAVGEAAVADPRAVRGVSSTPVLADTEQARTAVEAEDAVAPSGAASSPIPLPEQDRLVRLSRMSGVEQERIAAIADREDGLAELEVLLKTAREPLSRIKQDIFKTKSDIFWARLEQGLYIQAEQSLPMITPQMPGEEVVSGVFYDERLGKDVRRSIRIMPGEHPVLDALLQRAAFERAAIKKVAEDHIVSVLGRQWRKQ